MKASVIASCRVFGAGQPFAVEAEGARVLNDQLDRVEAEVTFDDGFTASFISSRVAVGR